MAFQESRARSKSEPAGGEGDLVGAREVETDRRPEPPERDCQGFGWSKEESRSGTTGKEKFGKLFSLMSSKFG
jgi:hypothetical protein